MVVFLDLDEDDVADDPHANPGEPAGLAVPRRLPKPIASTAADRIGKESSIDSERPNPNLNVISEALGCYPFAFDHKS